MTMVYGVLADQSKTMILNTDSDSIFFWQKNTGEN
jgi:hypothetical protein